jgi:predicted chitinase/pyrimidine deaminase RibD-like protein
MLRNSGCIRLLKDAMMAQKDRELSLRETPARPFRYGFGSEVDEASLADMRAAFAVSGNQPVKQEVFRSPYEYEKVKKQREAERQEKITKIARTPVKPWPMSVKEGHQGQAYSSEDGVAASTKMFCEDSDDAKIHDFIQHVATELGIDPMPKIHLHSDPKWSTHNHSFGRYDPDTHTLNVSMPNRHILDVFRTVAHELVHCSQNQQHGQLPDDAGETGSDWENDANARAGIIMRDWANTHPEEFEQLPLGEGASGYIPKNKRESALPQYAMALSVDIKPGETGRQANKLALHTGRNGEPGLLMKTVNLRESASDYQIHNTKKLDRVLARCCEMIERGQQKDPKRYGQVAACVIDPDNNMVYGINLPGTDGRRRHAERVAIDRYHKTHGDIPEGSIVVTTCSPCNSPMDERAGESCKDLINSVGIHKVYCGYIDPTQHDDEDADFTIGVTQNDDLWDSCKAFADTFLHEDELEEGWRNALAGAAATAAMALTPAPANSTATPSMSQLSQPATVQQAPSTSAESALTQAAKAAGIQGVELAQFLAQCAHESGDFAHMEELGGKNYLAKYDPSVNPAKARALGNTQAGDGAKYKGRGYIQITGKANYATAGQALGIDLVNNPEAAARPDVAAKVAVWYWQNRVAPYVQDFSDTRGVTKRINPGLQGLQDRQSNFQDYQQQMAAVAQPTRVAAVAQPGVAV